MRNSRNGSREIHSSSNLNSEILDGFGLKVQLPGLVKSSSVSLHDHTDHEVYGRHMFVISGVEHVTSLFQDGLYMPCASVQ